MSRSSARARSRMPATIAAMALVAGMLAVAVPSALGATPSSGTITASDAGTKILSYTGTVPPGAGSPGPCEDGVNADVFTVTLQGLTAAFYANHKALLRAHIEWDPQFSPEAGGSDLALELRRNGQTIASSDGGTAEETVSLDHPLNGQYQVVACAFANAAPQDYEGTVSLTTGHVTPLPAASPNRGLSFMPLVVADPQRDLGEPTLRIDKDGIIYHCAPFGSSRNADYASRSTDGGDTFRVLGTPPEGRIAPGGGGDCDMSIAPRRNDQGKYTVSYAGLEALANFSTGRSEDNGRSWQGTNTSETIPVVDRQWLESNGTQEVYLFYNQIPEGGTVQRSTDGGLTYAPANPGNAAPNITRPGNIVLDRNSAHNVDGKNNEMVFVAYTNGNNVQISRSTDQGQTFKRIVVAHAQGEPDNLFPSIDIDTAGNLYVAWVEAGSYNAYYSFSKDHGTTWSPKRLVNRRGAQTNLMPWVAAGSPGRIAVAFYCSPVDGNPQTSAFHGPWNVCVNESFDALSATPHFSQTRAAHHPTHWDSICTSGLGCDLSAPPGDRSLLDFFELRMDPRDGRVMVLFTDANKHAGQPAGLIAIDMFAKQRAGPSLLAGVGTVQADPRPIVRSQSFDRINDAKFPISSFGAPPPQTNQINSLDIQWVRVSKTSLPRNPNALQVQMKVRDLSDAGLGTALVQMASQQLKFVVRWKSGYRPDFVVADWRPGQGFTFHAGHLFFDRTEDGKLEIYSGDKTPVASVNQGTGVITWKLPYWFMQDYDIKDLTKKPEIDQARPGDFIWEVAGWTFGRPSPQPGVLDYYNQADSTPSFDFRLP